MAEYIERGYLLAEYDRQHKGPPGKAQELIANAPAADVLPVPEGGIGEMSDGYHTFNGLYYQRMVLFSALVNAYNDKAWKSWKHEDGEHCFGGGWFIVGIDTQQGSYTYHYEDKYWNWFECEELPVAKHWDGHTEADVTRLLSLPDVAPVRHGRWIVNAYGDIWECSVCGVESYVDEDWRPTDDRAFKMHYCHYCGARMDLEEEINQCTSERMITATTTPSGVTGMNAQEIVSVAPTDGKTEIPRITISMRSSRR